MPTPNLASASRVQLRYIPEATLGVTPVTGNPYNLRMTGETLDFALVKTSDKEIRQDRQMSSTTTTDANAGGDLKVHMQYAEFDRLFAALMQSSWSAYGVNGVGTSFAATITAGTLGVTASTITAGAAPTTTSALTLLKPGQWFKLIGDPLNTKPLRVSSSVAVTGTVITLDVNTPCVASSPNVTLSSSRLTNGVTMPTFTLEKAMNDVGQFMTYRGMAVSKFSTAFTAKQLTEGTFTFLGKDMIRNVATQLPGAPVASQTYDLQNAVKGVGTVWEGGAPLATTFLQSMTLDIDNTLRAQEAVGVLGLAGIGSGTFMVKGNMTLYFADGSQYDKFLNDVYTSVTLSSQDSAGNGYVFTLPKIMLTSGKIQAGAKDTDLLAVFGYEAYGDLANANTALQQTLFIDRIGAAVLP